MTSGAMASVRAALAAGLLWSTPALAEDIGAPVPARLREDAAAVARMMDADRDGRISKAEFLRHNALTSRFVALDADGDGALDQAEQQAVNVGPRSQR